MAAALGLTLALAAAFHAAAPWVSPALFPALGTTWGQFAAWQGAAFLAGWWAHLGGDALTVQGVPALWPRNIRGRRWRMLSTGTMHAGGIGELAVVTPLLTVALGAAVLGLAGWWPPILAAAGAVIEG